MSYSSEIKEALLSRLPKKACCRRSMLFAAFFARGSAKDGILTLSAAGEGYLAFLKEEITAVYHKAPTLSRRAGRSAFLLSFAARQGEDYLSKIDRDAACNPFTALPYKPCDACKTAFLSGIFLACGRIQPPEKAYHLEFSIGERRDKLALFLSSLGYPPRSVDRREERLLYYKDNATIGDLSVMIGLPSVGYDLVNAYIMRGYRRDAVRRANCETGNITRAVESSMRQIDILTRLFRSGKASLLPPELYETAKLRLENSELSLARLAAITSPPITKSGLHHRLEKIMELAERLLCEDGRTK